MSKTDEHGRPSAGPKLASTGAVHTWEATGILSGDDQGCMALDVTATEFERVRGHAPRPELDGSKYNTGLFKLQPEFGFDADVTVRIRVVTTELEEEDGES